MAMENEKPTTDNARPKTRDVRLSVVGCEFFIGRDEEDGCGL
jgi:hypothetical protein